MSTTEFTYDVASALWQGARPYQEDNLQTGFEGGASSGFSVLADGMGGAAAGGLASELVVVDAFERLEGLMDDPEGLEARLHQELRGAIETANQVIADRGAEDISVRGMGATFLATVLFGNRLYWASVGDSPLFLFRNGELHQINEDHSLAPVIDQMVERGELTAEEARRHPDRNALTSVLMGDNVKRIDIPETPLELHLGDVVITASDGLQFLAEDQIADVLRATGAEASSAEICSKLMDAVKALGHPQQDNTAIAVIRPMPPGSVPPPAPSGPTTKVILDDDELASATRIRPVDAEDDPSPERAVEEAGGGLSTHGGEETDPPPPQPVQRKLPIPLIAGGGLVVLLLILAAVFIIPGRTPEATSGETVVGTDTTETGAAEGTQTPGDTQAEAADGSAEPTATGGGDGVVDGGDTQADPATQDADPPVNQPVGDGSSDTGAVESGSISTIGSAEGFGDEGTGAGEDASPVTNETEVEVESGTQGESGANDSARESSGEAPSVAGTGQGQDQSQPGLGGGGLPGLVRPGIGANASAGAGAAPEPECYSLGEIFEANALGRQLREGSRQLIQVDRQVRDGDSVRVFSWTLAIRLQPWESAIYDPEDEALCFLDARR